MASFDFNQVDQLQTSSNDGKLTFLKLQDDGWYAKVRFMYGEGESFEVQTVHNVSEEQRKPKYVPCLRGLGDPLEACPLCKAGSKINTQFFIPVYVISIVSNVRGVTTEEPVNQVMVFQKGTTFKAAISSVLRQTAKTGRPIVSSVFNLVRNGAANDQKTTYTAELVGTDDITLAQLPPKPQIKGSYILPDITAQEMQEKYVDKKPVATQQTPAMPAGVAPRTLNMNSFAGNTVVGAQPAPAQPVQGTIPQFGQPAQPVTQAPSQAPVITNMNVPF